MSIPTSKVRKAFFGVWIAAAAVLLMVGRAGGAVGGPDGLRLAPIAPAQLGPVISVQAPDVGGSAVN